jgi:hypothetical protein
MWNQCSESHCLQPQLHAMLHMYAVVKGFFQTTLRSQTTTALVTPTMWYQGATARTLRHSTHSLTVDNVELFNKETWGWLGCSNLQAGQNIYLSTGSPPFPAPVENAVYGPQVPGTLSNNNSSASWAHLNPCPLNACCNIWGQCGSTIRICRLIE